MSHFVSVPCISVISQYSSGRIAMTRKCAMYENTGGEQSCDEACGGVEKDRQGTIL